MPNDDGLLVHAELVFHEGQPDGPPGCDRIWHVAEDTREPGDLIQPLYLIILTLQARPVVSYYLVNPGVPVSPGDVS